jgi:nucleotide-binding universal stress UspA family protein
VAIFLEVSFNYSKSYKMKRILVPIDFSASAANTLKFANKLAVDKGMDLTLLYCYPVEDYSRKYDFPGMTYGQGIQEKLKNFYHDNISDQIGDIKFLARAGSVVERVVLLSVDFQLILLSSKEFSSSVNRWFGTHTSAIASLASCPVVLVPSMAEYTPWESIWHIKRKEKESSIIEPWLTKIGINPDCIEIKFLEQTSFTSMIWKSMVAFINKPQESLRKSIIEASPTKEINLIILVSHQKNTFQSFVHNEAVQILFEFGIPVIVFQAKSKPEEEEKS